MSEAKPTSQIDSKLEVRYADHLEFLWEQYNKLLGLGVIASALTLGFLLQVVLFNKDVREVIAELKSPLNTNWLVVAILVLAGGFSGRARASILTDELVSFAEQLHPLCETLNGTAEFSTLEGQLLLKLLGDGRGHINLTGEVLDRAGLGNTLSFSFEFDQTLLQRSIHELDSVIRAFPVRIEEANKS